MWRVVFASGNKHKFEEMRALLPKSVIELDFSSPGLDVEENGDTYEENALIKARAWMRHTGRPALADDSGLEVDALGGAPGLRSARVASTSELRLQWLLRSLEGLANRRARFVAAVALVFPDGCEIVVRGVCEGKISEEIAGIEGFGYDPLFIPEGEERTFAELGDLRKGEISHRSRACRALLDVLRTKSVVEYSSVCSQ